MGLHESSLLWPICGHVTRISWAQSLGWTSYLSLPSGTQNVSVFGDGFLWCQLSWSISICHVWMWHEALRGAVILFGPAASSLPHALLLKGKPRCASACGRCALLLKTAQHPLRSLRSSETLLIFIYLFLRMSSAEPLELHGRSQTTYKMSSKRWSHWWCLLREVICALKFGFLNWSFGFTMKKWSQSWNEDMDFARRVWLFFLLKLGEFHTGNDAVNVRVSDVSTSLMSKCFIIWT